MSAVASLKVACSAGGVAALAYYVYVANGVRDPSANSSQMFGSATAWFESVTTFGSAAQSLAVAVLGLLLFQSINWNSSASKQQQSFGGASTCSSAATPSGSARNFQSHPVHDINQTPPPKGGQLFRRIRRLLSEGKARARQLTAAPPPGLSRRRSFSSRSSKSEDVFMPRLTSDNKGRGLGARKYVPSMSRIASGMCLNEMAGSEASFNSAGSGKRLELLSYNGCQAVDCLAHDNTPEAYKQVCSVVTDTHLLQFGALIGEASAKLALSQAGSPTAIGPEPGCLFGAFDKVEQYRQGWELIVEEHKPGLHYWTWRRHLRKNLFMYKSKTVYEDVTTAQVVAFTYDLEGRMAWDESTTALSVIASPTAPTAPLAGPAQSCYLHSRTKFPPPMASREYVYARRVWTKPDDGGLYCIQRSAPHPAPPVLGGRVVRVDDFVSGYVVRSAQSSADPSKPAVEVVSVYFEDSHCSAGITNMGVRRALWPMVQKAEAALRSYIVCRMHGELARPVDETAGATDDATTMRRMAAAAAAAAAASDGVSEHGRGGNGGVRGAVKSLIRRAVPNPLAAVYHGYLVTCQACTQAAVGMVRAVRFAGSCMVASAKASARACMLPLAGLRYLAQLAATSRANSLPWLQAQAATLARVSLFPIWKVRLVRGRSPEPSCGGAVSLSSSPSKSALDLDRAPSLGASCASFELPSSCSSSLSGKEGVRSHPLRAPGLSVRVREAPADSCGGASAATTSSGGAESPRAARGAGARRGLLRRCRQLVVRAAKAAGANLLLGQVAKSSRPGQSEMRDEGAWMRAKVSDM